MYPNKEAPWYYLWPAPALGLVPHALLAAQLGMAACDAVRPEGVPFSLTVLLLEGEYRLTGAVLFCLSQQAGVRVHLLSRNVRSPFRFSGYVRKHHVCCLDRPETEFVEYVQTVARQIQANVLLPVDVPGMRFMIAHRAALAAAVPVLSLPSAANYEIANDKGWLAAFMQEWAIPAPDTILDIQQGLAGKLEGFRFPVLLKPIDGSGGGGIVRYHTPAALLQAVTALPANCRYIVQNCLEGYDIDCNVLYDKGQLLAHSIQKGLVPTGGEFAPTEAIEFVRNDAVLAVVDRLMRALNWDGVAHIDLRYDARDRQIKVIEVNTRFWLTVAGSALAARVNFPVLACLAAAGQPVVQHAPFELGCYIPFTSFLRQRLARQPTGDPAVRFTLRDTSVRAFLSDPLTKIYRAWQNTF